MSVPAFRALKESFGCDLTLLTSPASAPAVSLIEEIDDVIVYESPWNREDTPAENTLALISELRNGSFDAAIIFTVYSQNPLPAALTVFLAGIPRRLAYCRENPYQLLTDWVADKEPYCYISHQVQRDLDLVACVGARTTRDEISLCWSAGAWTNAREKILRAGWHPEKPWMILHAGVSEVKRRYAEKRWIEAARMLHGTGGFQLLFTGVDSERDLTGRLSGQLGEGALDLSGTLSLEEFVALIAHAPVVVTVNTATVHLAAATGTPVVVLYAMTNPQHTPWRVLSRVLAFHPPKDLLSRNQVVRFVYQWLLERVADDASPDNVVRAVMELTRSAVAGAGYPPDAFQ